MVRLPLERLYRRLDQAIGILTYRAVHEHEAARRNATPAPAAIPPQSKPAARP